MEEKAILNDRIARISFSYGDRSMLKVIDGCFCCEPMLYDMAAMDKTALAITLLIAFIAAMLVFVRLYFGAQIDS